MTCSPTCLNTGSASPVSSDSSTSRPSHSSTSPSTTTRSPVETSTTSSRTTWFRATTCSMPSRRTRGLASPTTASWSRVRLARSSWTMPTPVFASATTPKRPSRQFPKIMISAKSTAMTALNKVKVLALTIWPSVRLVACSTSLPSPRASRSATSRAVSPCWAVAVAELVHAVRLGVRSDQARASRRTYADGMRTVRARPTTSSSLVRVLAGCPRRSGSPARGEG